MNAGVNAQAALPSLADDVNTYLSFGEHRAGMPSEARTATWIRERLDQLGYQTDFQRFPIRTLLQPGGQITVGNAKADLFPQWLPPAASLGKLLEAPLLPLDAEKAEPSIRIISKPMPPAGNWGTAQDAWVNEAAAKGALALVFAADERTGELYASNQHHFEPLPIPVGVLARRALPELADVGFWFHFGASLATTKLDAHYGVTSPQFLVGTNTSEASVRPALAPFLAGYANGNAKTPGEAGQVLGAGYQRFAGMIGTFPGFHTPADRGEAIDFAQLEKIAEASAAVIKRAAAPPT